MARLRQAIFERLKKTVTVWLAVYPSVLLVISLVGDCIEGWPMPLRVLGATLMIVPIVTNISEPAVRTVMGQIEKAILQRRMRTPP
jgi:antibiotic biosynthesis monooxygenase (ABM) superfamily enzyme